MRVFEIILLLSVFVSGCGDQSVQYPPVSPPAPAEVYQPQPVVTPPVPVQPPVTYPSTPVGGENWASGYTVSEDGLRVTIAVNDISFDTVARVTWSATGTVCAGCRFVGLDVDGRTVIVDYRSTGSQGAVDVIRRDLERVVVWAMRPGR